ncbi:hypothetical protein B0H14DRAFT_2627256 [Mycena olivaceomarginata]|nr:hypothetical protein B0H14DRAFT_2627256 [Mycena olivaceomarginata]
MHSALLTRRLGTASNSARCATGGKTSAKASVHEEDVLCFCVAVESNKTGLRCAAVASLACHGTGLPTTTDAWRDSDATLLPTGATSAQSNLLYTTARENETGGPWHWSRVHSTHACGKALSTSALGDTPATLPALATRVQAGEREKDAVEQPNSALSPLPYPHCGVGGRPCSCASLHPHLIPPSVSTSSVGESPPPAWPYEVVRSARENCLQDTNGGPYMQCKPGTIIRGAVDTPEATIQPILVLSSPSLCNI